MNFPAPPPLGFPSLLRKIVTYWIFRRYEMEKYINISITIEFTLLIPGEVSYVHRY